MKTLISTSGTSLSLARFMAIAEVSAGEITAGLGYLPLNPANNLSDVASVATARTNLGVSASGADTAYAWRTNNLSDLTSVATARTNLGLGNVENKSSATIRSEITSANVTAALTYTPLNPANNLSDVGSIATARTNLGVAAVGADAAYAWRTNNLSDLSNAGTARTNLGLGTAATQNTGTSGATVPLLNAANTFAANTVFDGIVGIGTTSLASGKLIVSTSATSSNVCLLYNLSATPYGMAVLFSNASPNNASNYFVHCGDSSTTRAVIYSNGGLHNYQSNNVNLSDAAVKTDIARYSDADLDALEASFVTVDWGRFKYQDQTHTDWNHGYTAQGVEAAFAGVAPELVDETELGPQVEAGAPKRKAVYDTDLTHIGLALLARALARIADLEARLNAAGL